MDFLVAEDDRLSSLVLCKMLESYGTVIAVSDGNAALDLIKNNFNKFDLVFLDLMLAGLGGEEVLNKLRDFELTHEIPLEKQTKVVFVSASDDEEQIFNAHLSGCSGYIVKPITRDRLRALLLSLNLIKE